MPRRKRFDTPGRPVSPEGPIKQINIGLPFPLLAEVDAKAIREKLTRSEAIRVLVRKGLEAEKPPT